MSSITSTNPSELTITREEVDNSKITINTNNNKLILENNSSDVTISKYEVPTSFSNIPSTTNSSLTMKTQVLPLVYIQNSAKIPFPGVNNTNNSNNVIVNNIPQFQFATLGTKNSTSLPTTSVAMSTNQNVIFATGRPQPLVIQKPQGNMVPIVPVSVSTGAKITGAYLTMLKTVPKSNETTNMNKIQLSGNKLQDFSVINNNSYIPTQNPTQKFVIAPMPKVTTNRLPTTATTNSVQPKIALLPMPVPKTEPTVTKQKIYNFKIADGQLQSDSNTSAVTIMCDNSNDNSADGDSNSENLVCDEIINLDSPGKGDVNNKTYELSIMEESVSSQSDAKLSNYIAGTSVLKIPPKTDIISLPQKEGPKFPKHGISILKKNYSNFADRKLERSGNLIFSNINSKNSISENKELIEKKLSADSEDVVITIPSSIPPRPDKERRRKSNFSYRKEFDDMEVISTSTQKSVFDIKPFENKEDTKKCLTDEIEIEVIKEKCDINMNDDCDFQKTLEWEDGIGILPGSNLKFIINEFNIVEYVTEEEYKKIMEKRIAKAKEKMKMDFQEEMRCLECGCYGLPSEFINPKFCSYDCQEAAQNKTKKEKQEQYKKKKKKPKKESPVESNTKFEIKTEKESGSEDDSNDNSSQDKFMSYPWACKKKGFSWSKYLEHLKVKAAPVKLFKDPFPYTRNGFRPGMKLEGVDPQHPSYFCVFTVAEVTGYRIRLHFDGYPDNYDFWCNADSMDIFPIGWCEKYSHILQAPPGYTNDNFNWVQYLKNTKSTAAPKHLFANRAGQAICPNGFRVGMKLEAVDRKNTSLVCVATVRDMMDNRILVHFDSWDDIYDYWADPTSPYIHPVGWCDQYGHNLTPPNDYPSPETFSWEVYLKETKSVAAPVRAFKQRPACGFKRGMRLECVDKRVPQLIRVATVDDVKEHQIRIHFDGWLDRYSYWVDDDSPDVHPIGWCQKTGHPLEPPLTPDDVYDFLECQTVGCRGQGHIRGPKYATHSNQKHCPYAEENVDAEKILPDRLLSPDRSPEAVVPISREPKECKIKPRLGRPPKYLRLEQPKPDPDEPPLKKPKRKYKKQIKVESTDFLHEKAMLLIEQSKIIPAERESWRKHSQFLKKYINAYDDPRSWTNSEVVEFVSSLPYCNRNMEVFKKEEIDGEALLSLSQKDILTILKIKVGPAVKLYNSIILLRQHADENLFT